MSVETIRVVGMQAERARRVREHASEARGGVVIDVTDTTRLSSWQDVEHALSTAFMALRDAKQRDVNVVAIVRADDEFGRQGPLSAMVACALTSAVRTLALEARRLRLTANVVADDGGEPGALLDTVCGLLKSEAVTGQVIVVGRGHLGKVPV
jgi:hypothetical protein